MSKRPRENKPEELSLGLRQAIAKIDQLSLILFAAPVVVVVPPLLPPAPAAS